jgi:hypothetical protein
MARSNSILRFNGKLGEINAYTLKDADPGDGFIIRTNGGPSRKQIKSLESCILVRKNNDDFGTSSAAAKAVRLAIHPVKHLADINIQPKLTALCKYIQREDKKQVHGEKAVQFSQFGSYLSGFNLNKRFPFDSVVRHPLMATLHRDTGTGEINLPELHPGIGLSLPWQQPLYRLIFSLGTAADRWTASRGNYAPEVVSFITPWTISQQFLPAQKIILQLKEPVKERECMIIAAGIEIGTMLSDAVIQPVKNTGCAKVLIAG